MDLQLFRPIEREAGRRSLGISRTTLLSVGHLIPRKGHDLVIQGLRWLPELDLIVIGDGPEREALGALARESGAADRVRFVGSLAQEELRNYFGAADALVLASSREGWANVLLESMACGKSTTTTSGARSSSPASTRRPAFETSVATATGSADAR
ncbi:MAG TPA: glycosyltransferase [Burkholderiales bacterium]